MSNLSSKILVINTGSSSLKFQLIEMYEERSIIRGTCERIGEEMLRDLDADKNAHDSGKQAQHETGRDEFQGKVARLLGARLRHLVLEGICG